MIWDRRLPAMTADRHWYHPLTAPIIPVLERTLRNTVVGLGISSGSTSAAASTPHERKRERSQDAAGAVSAEEK